MSNPFVVDVRRYPLTVGGGMMHNAGKALERGYKEWHVPNSVKWETCMHISEALDNQHVWMWLDKLRGVKLYGRFKHGSVTENVDGRKFITEIKGEGLTRVEKYKDSLSVWGHNITTLRPLEKANSNRRLPPDYNFDALDASVNFEFIVKETACGQSPNLYDSVENRYYIARRIVSSDHSEIYHAYKEDQCCNDPVLGYGLKAPPTTEHINRLTPRLLGRTEECSNGIILQVALTSRSVSKDNLLHVPNAFWSRSKYSDQMRNSGLLESVQHYTDVHHDEDGKKTPCTCDDPWPWDAGIRNEL